MPEITAITDARSGVETATATLPADAWQRRMRPLMRRLVPSRADCLFVALLAWTFMFGKGWHVLLGDGDTGWHIRAGEYILDHGTVPATDLFSFSRAGQAWYAWEWLSDVIFASLFRGWGLKGVVLVAGTALALAFAIAFRYAVWRGANGAVALAVILMAASASTIHFLARPHVFSLLLVPVFLWMLERDRERPGAVLWCLVPLAAVWTNLHGGFLILIVSVWLLAGVELWTGAARWRAGVPDWRPARRYGALAGLCSLATLANPFGWRLHAHVFAYMQSDWIRKAVEEFQSPSFRSESMAQFELLLFAGLCLTTVLIGRRQWYPALLVLFWAHAALGSARHIPVFVLAASPLLAVELSRMLIGWSRPWRPGSVQATLRDVLVDFDRGNRGTSVWGPALVLCLALVNPSGWWPQDFPDVKFPVHMVNRHPDYFGLRTESRILAPDQWGDYLLFRFYPNQRVFIDGRSDFYGPEIGKQYVRILNGLYGWDRLLDRYRIDTALIPPDWPLAELLKRDRAWRLVADDGLALLFVRARFSAAGLMNPARSAERITGGHSRMSRGATRPGPEAARNRADCMRGVTV